ncbi:MAG: bifunctional riboflavin kinase/FMN adenylyltransferase [Methanoculleus sp. SDB]|nr:MAG: bifunctional riboflavin kinase/FMN adenylyltransferase [Methanoculleus sp. SDB]
MMRIVLVGYRGSGKTTVGTLLAGALGIPFIDTDALIEERAGMSIPEIFRSGEENFRMLERSVIASLAGQGGVISTGGGAVTDPVNVALLRHGGPVVFLFAPADVLGNRIRGSTRPALTPLPPDEEIRTVLLKRMPAYVGASDCCIDTEAIDPGEVCRRVRQAVAGGTVPETDRSDGFAFLKKTPLPPEELEGLKKFLDEQTRADMRLCAVIGNPCLHSKSPALFNHLFSRSGLKYWYTRIQWPSLGPVMDCARALDIKGLSVTIPFKSAVMPYLSDIDRHAAAIGAVNTVVRCGDRAYGYNTDWLGVRQPLQGMEPCSAVVLGAGGAAAAAAYALGDLGMDTTILARNPGAAEALAQRFGAGSGPLTDFDRIDPDLVINATPVGMGDGKSVLEEHWLRPGMTVFDLVYTPPETPLLRLARRHGCRCIGGREMFVAQASAQFRLFTGIRADPGLIREVI